MCGDDTWSPSRVGRLCVVVVAVSMIMTTMMIMLFVDVVRYLLLFFTVNAVLHGGTSDFDDADDYEGLHDNVDDDDANAFVVTFPVLMLLAVLLQ